MAVVEHSVTYSLAGGTILGCIFLAAWAFEKSPQPLLLKSATLVASPFGGRLPMSDVIRPSHYSACAYTDGKRILRLCLDARVVRANGVKATGYEASCPGTVLVSSCLSSAQPRKSSQPDVLAICDYAWFSPPAHKEVVGISPNPGRVLVDDCGTPYTERITAAD